MDSTLQPYNIHTKGETMKNNVALPIEKIWGTAEQNKQRNLTREEKWDHVFRKNEHILTHTQHPALLLKRH